MKNSLFKEINRENAPECEGCPFLSFENWGKPLESGIKYLSFEYHSVCNMKCSYCSDTYYGGKKAVYDVVQTVDSLKDSDKLSNIPYVVWGGGEPTLDKNFVQLLQTLDTQLDSTKQRVITNGIKFVPELKDLLDNNKGYIVTSIDAGSEEVFQEVRGVSKLDTVMKNLQKYSKDTPSNVIIKYLLLDNNKSIEELEKFTELIKEYKLNSCNFQISYNFKSDEICFEDLKKLIYLYCLLLKNSVEFIFLDDLVWQRLKSISTQELEKILLFLEENSLLDYIAKDNEYKNLVVWGTGAQAKLILNKSLFFKNNDVKFFVDPRENVINTKFFDKDVKDPSEIKKIDCNVFIAAVQSAPLIYQQYKELGFDTNKIVKKLIL
jgi:pyruvate-formate lyase-activating enzyme